MLVNVLADVKNTIHHHHRERVCFYDGFIDTDSC